MKKLLLAIFFVVFSNKILFAVTPPAYLFAYVDKNKITIGDRVKLTLVLSYSDDTRLEPFLPEDNLKSFEVKNYKISKAKKKYFLFGRRVKKYEYNLSTFTTGIYEIRPFVIKFTAKNGSKSECQTSPLKIEVASMLDRESASDIKDIKPPVNFKGSGLLYIASLLVALCIIAGFIAWRNYLKKDEFYASMPENIDPYEYAAGELEKLKNSDLIKSGMVKEFYVRLTYIVRIYLSKIFSVNIADMTTTEAVKALREKGADKKFLMDLREFFDSADLVKFAKYVPEVKDIDGSYAAAETIEENVKPAEEQPPVPEAGK